MRRKYIVAGSYQQANQWLSEQEPEPGVKYLYVSRAEILLGLSFGPEDVVYVGTYWEHKEFTAITEQLNHIHDRAKWRNGT